MYISQYLPKPEQVIAAALASSKIKPTSDDDTVRRAIGDTMAAMARQSLRDEVLVDLSDALALYEVNNGAYTDIPKGDEGALARDEYESGVDDAVETALEKYNEYLSADWLGRETIDTQLWVDGQLTAKAESAAKEIWKQLTHDKTPAKVLANAGITAPMIEAAIATIRKGEKPVTDQSAAPDMTSLLGQMKTHLGDGYDVMAVYEDLEMVFDDDEDELLAASAAARLGLSDAGMKALQIAALNMDSPVDDVSAALAAYTGPTDAAPSKPKRQPRADKASVPVEGAVSADVLIALKNNGAQDTVMAESLGVSRSTYTNWFSRKAAFSPTNEQHNVVRAELVKRANELLAALATLDGVNEPLSVG